MEQVPTSILSNDPCHLGEGPTYDATTNTAWWFDIREGRLSPKSPTEETVLGRPAYRFDVATTAVWVDRELRLPIQVEIRDAAGGLAERHRFTKIRLNPGLTDQVFTL